MKKFLLPVLLIVFGWNTTRAQEQQSQITKNIEVEEVNGEVTVTVTETNGSEETVNVYTGDEAIKFLDKNAESNSYFFKEEDGDEVIVVEIEGDENASHYWFDKDDFDINIELDMSELTKQLEALKDELDELDKTEITSRIDEMLQMQNEMKSEQVIALKNLHESDDEFDDIDVRVEERNGNIIIIRSEGGNKVVEEIILDGDNNNKQVVVKSLSGNASGSSSNFDVNVYPNPNNGAFTIDLTLNNEESTSVKVVDVSGKVVYKKSVKGKESHSLKVDLKKPSAGVYVVIVEQQDEIVKLKTIIE